MKTAAVLAFPCLVAAIAAARPQAAPKPSAYTDAAYGFSLEAPQFPKLAKGGTVIPVVFLAPAENGFTSNVNVMVQSVSTTADQYSETSKAGFKASGMELLSEKKTRVSGRDALLFDYEGKQQGRDLRFLALAVVEAERVLLVTCTALKKDFGKVEKEFKACLDSLKLSE